MMGYRLAPSGPVWPINGVYKLPEMNGWMVPSSRNNQGTEVWYLVTWATVARPGSERIVYRCTCSAGADRVEMSPHPSDPALCRHVLAVTNAEQAGADRLYAPRPAGRAGDLSRFT